MLLASEDIKQNRTNERTLLNMLNTIIGAASGHRQGPPPLSH